MKIFILSLLFCSMGYATLVERCETDNFNGPELSLYRFSETQIEAHLEGGEVIEIFSWRETEKGTVYFGEEFFFEVYRKLGSSPVSFIPSGGYYFRGIMYLRGEVTTAFCRD